MKRYLLIFTLLILALSLSACGHTHEFGEWKVTRMATCTQTGLQERVCECGEVDSVEFPKATHNFGEWKLGKASSCVEAGYNERSCSCGEKETSALPLGDHKFGEETVTTQPTCTQEGVKSQSCSVCGEKTTSSIPATGHDWKNATCTVPKTCNTCNATEGATCDHTYKDATCTTPKTCTVCGHQEGSKAAHKYAAATCTKPETCSVCGAPQGSALGCTAGSDGNCIRCGKSMVKLSSVLSAPMDTINEIGSFVSSYYIGDCYSKGNFRFIFNSADGIILSWGATNTSNKDIKYLTFTINYYNSVGDPAKDDISGKTSYTARITGPIGAGKSFYMRKLIGYGSDVMYGTITNVKIEYMDGSTVSGNYGYTTWHNIRSSASPKECLIFEK